MTEQTPAARLEAFIAARHRTSRVLDRGTLIHPQWGRVPAVRILNSIYGQTWVWAYTGSRRKEKTPSSWENHSEDSSYRPGEDA